MPAMAHPSPPSGQPVKGPAPRRRTVLLAMAAVLTVLLLRTLQRPAIDFAVFHRAGARLLAGADLYATLGGEYPYRYAPGAAALFAPLGLLPFGAARAIWALASAALVLVATAVLQRRLGARRWFAVPLAWLCLMQPLVQELHHGQADLLVLGLCLAAFALQDRGRELSAGAALAVAVGLKVAPVLLAFDWLVRRRWRALAGVGIGLVLLGLALVPTYGVRGAWAEHLAWLTTQSAQAGDMIANVANQSFWAMAAAWGLPRGAAAAAVAAVAIAAVSAGALELRRALLLAAIPLASAYGWPQLFVLAVPLAALLLSGSPAVALGAGPLAAVATALSYDVAGARIEEWAQGHRILGMALLGLFLVGRLAGPAAVPAGPGEQEPGGGRASPGPGNP